ncbi:MAG: DUF2851 family protein [Bacteroidales bacterium]|nr:DUF2851 family protein [Bacteroidales bacterium]
MTEEFLHYIWQYRLYSPNLVLQTGEQVEVLHPGVHNTDSGPDFFNAKIRIGKTIWAGNIEIHILSSDWKRHNHQQDMSYDTVILHVVWRDDLPVFRKDSTQIPTLELDGLYNENSWKNYLKFMASPKWIPCDTMISNVDSFLRNAWLDRVLVERLERKSLQVEHILSLTKNDWSHTFYRLLAHNMGFKLNNQAFEMLAQSLPYQFLAKHADDLFQVEAMVFGQAGLLGTSFTDEYPQKLKKEYEFLKSKFDLTPIDSHLWRFMRLHPGNFPTLRLAQFASVIHHSKSIISELFSSNDVKTYRNLFGAEASGYWNTHYTFDKPSALKRKTLGLSSIDLLIINLVAPILVAYGRWKNDTPMIEKAVDLLMQLKSENNTYTRNWVKIGIFAKDAAISQSLIELKSQYCDNKKCLSCAIGIQLLK